MSDEKNPLPPSYNSVGHGMVYSQGILNTNTAIPVDPHPTKITYIQTGPYMLQQPGMATVFVNQPIVYNPGSYFITSRYSQITNCNNCHMQVSSRVSYETGAATWLSCLALSVIGFWCGCCLIPFCLNDAKDARHYCPCCNGCIGVKKLL